MWLTTKAVLTGSPIINLGPSFSAWMRACGWPHRSAGRNGNMPSLRAQLERLFSATITAIDDRPNTLSFSNAYIANLGNPWWRPGQWTGTLELSKDFFYATRKVVPLKMDAVAHLQHSCLALDLYAWLTYRMSRLTRETTVPWVGLLGQFGAKYGDIEHFIKGLFP